MRSAAFHLEPASRLPCAPGWAVAIVVAWCALLAAVELLAPGESGPIQCRLRLATGMPCPTCGSTRAAFALMRGDPGAAIVHNPMVVLGGIALACALGFRLVTARRIVVAWTPRRRTGTAIMVILALLANWAWVIRTA